MALTTKQIAAMTDGLLEGSPEVEIKGVNRIDAAEPDQLTFVGDAAHARQWAQSRAAALLLAEGVQLPDPDDRPVIRVVDVDLAMVELLNYFAPPVAHPADGVHPSAVIDPSALIGENVRIGPHVHVGPRARIDDGCELHANVVVLNDAVIGEQTVLWPGVVIRDRCTIGARCILHPGVVIGADGFGYRPALDGTRIIKIPQIGTVEIGDDVEIGANTCVDRGKFAATRIGSGSKLDNLVQIGHNCQIGRMVVVSGQTGVGGSTSIGDGALLGGACAIADHVTIGRGAKLAGGSQLMHDIPDGQTWAGAPAQPHKQTMRLHAALRQLPEIMREVRKRLRD